MQRPRLVKVAVLAGGVAAYIDTESEARAKHARWMSDPNFVEYMLAEISSITAA